MYRNFNVFDFVKRGKFEGGIPEKLKELIRTMGRTGDKLGIKVFLVGGFVRDVLLCRKNYDLDIVIEGDVLQFSKILAEKIGAVLVNHPKFGTTTLVKEWPKWLGPALHPDNKLKIDIATARREAYEKPAALPTVEFSSLREDLYRRDFTINAMAVNINKENFGLFLDFFGGSKDLEKGRIRVLHDKSFIDDPTRIFRAVRFEQRFGFKIETHTEYLITHAIKQEMFNKTENRRIRDELILMLKEENPEKAVLRMRELHELQFIHPDLVLDIHIKKKFRELKRHIKWYRKAVSTETKLYIWIMNLMLVLDELTIRQVEIVLKKFVFTRNERIKLQVYKKNAEKAIDKLSDRKRMKPGDIYDILKSFTDEVLIGILVKAESNTVRIRIKRFLTDYKDVELCIKGYDIQKEGIKPGPEYTKILIKILYKKLEGKLPTKKDELKFLKETINKTKDCKKERF